MSYSNTDNINALLNDAGVADDASEKIRKAAEKDPTVAKAVAKLTRKDLDAISAILNDRQALQRIMSSPKARELLKKYNG